MSASTAYARRAAECQLRHPGFDFDNSRSDPLWRS